ncbi:MAG: type II toxin-antitoxin system Phd/YefM family antitoxin [Candidatus Acidiferrales bacterium]
MRTVKIAELKDQLSRYIGIARTGEEVIVRDRNLPVARILPYLSQGASDDELHLVAAGKMRLPEKPPRWNELSKPRRSKLKRGQSIKALRDDREESR